MIVKLYEVQKEEKVNNLDDSLKNSINFHFEQNEIILDETNSFKNKDIDEYLRHMRNKSQTQTLIND